MTMRYDLRGHHALVTGAGHRLGEAFARGLAAQGADVVLHYGHSREAERIAAELVAAHGIRAVALAADLAQPDEAAGLAGRAGQAIGDIDLLVNSASIFEPPGVLDTDPATWDRHLAVNLTAPFLLSQAFARLRAGQAGAIVNLLDWRALRPGGDHFAYTITKSALAAMTRSLAQALAPEIRVNGLALGAILPPETKTDAGRDPLAGVPLRRWGTVEEAVEALLFLLAGPDFITGEILQLDGGRHLT